MDTIGIKNPFPNLIDKNNNNCKIFTGIKNPMFNPMNENNNNNDIIGIENPIFKLDFENNNINQKVMKDPFLSSMCENSMSDTTGIKNPMFKLKCENNNNISEMEESTFLVINKNNNKYNEPIGTQIQDSLEIINGQNLFDIYNEINEAMCNLQSNMNKVMTEFNNLKIIIKKFKKFLDINKDNLINNNLNIMINNNNNKINNDINTINNNIKLNNNIFNNNIFNNNKNDNIINNNNVPMMNMNVDFNNNFSNEDELKICFYKNGVIYDIICKKNESIKEIIDRYRDKAFDFEKNINFIFNSKILNPLLTPAEEQLYNNATIFIIK